MFVCVSVCITKTQLCILFNLSMYDSHLLSESDFSGGVAHPGSTPSTYKVIPWTDSFLDPAMQPTLKQDQFQLIMSLLALAVKR